jgi:Mn2+/Fe2+ NRAMP family transporter
LLNMATDQNTAVERERSMIAAARHKGMAATLLVYTRLSGPGWLQSAITLGGGSLAGSLYLGVLGGFSLLWLQPLAMVMGVIMLSAISYVALSVKERPFEAVNNHVNPVLGWGWAIATLMANLVWAMPQFSLGTAAIRQNLLPSLVGPASGMPETTAKLVVCGAMAAACLVVVWFYDSGSWGIKLFEIVLKLMVALVVLCFFGVIVRMSLAGVLDWKAILAGFVPDLGLLRSPAPGLEPVIQSVSEKFRPFWTGRIVSRQRDVMIAASAVAVGINMTFLMPYAIRRRGWDRQFRGLAIFDLATGLFIPFMLATSCVVIASAAQFHARPAAGLPAEGAPADPSDSRILQYKAIAAARIRHEIGAAQFDYLQSNEPRRIGELVDSLPDADKRIAAMLVNRDAFDLAQSLSPLTGEIFSHYIFGIGVIGMVTSSIIILMLINGFVVCEMLGIEPAGRAHRLACLMPAVGMLGPFIWTGGKAQFWLAVPTSVFGMTLLPIAYFSFYLLMNQKSLLKENMPKGARRLAWNILMALASSLAAFGSLWSLWSKLKWTGISIMAVFIALVLAAHIVRRLRRMPPVVRASSGH